MRCRLLGLSLCLLALSTESMLHAQQTSPTLDAKQADADFAFQGEYVGDIDADGDRTKVGIQVIALGSGKFQAVGYIGGLPGDGWGGVLKHSADGEISDGTLTIRNDLASVQIKGGIAKIQNNDGVMIGEFKQVIRESTTLGAKPPQGAVVLFDGSTADNFPGGKLDGNLLVQGVTSKQKFQSYSMHIEFLLSYMPAARGQGRGNSGCYAQGRYEVQILDSFGLSGEHNECGGIYSVKKPDVNMCFPPLSWQTYDIDFTAAKYDDSGKKTADARMTVKHNGVVIHNDVAVPKSTTAAPVAEGKDPGPIYLQDHGNPIRFRNIWVVEK
jgi:3-keto-disaccharide hydrolase